MICYIVQMMYVESSWMIPHLIFSGKKKTMIVSGNFCPSLKYNKLAWI